MEAEKIILGEQKFVWGRENGVPRDKISSEDAKLVLEAGNRLRTECPKKGFVSS